MKITKKNNFMQKEIKTKEQARQYAIEWQQWANKRKIFYTSELYEWEQYFTKLGRKFGLLKEFKENGII